MTRPGKRDLSHGAIDTAPCGLVTATSTGDILSANPTFCRWIGYDAQELVGEQRFQDLLAVGGRVFYHTHLAPLLELQGAVEEVKLDLRRNDGTVVPMLVNVCRRKAADSTLDDFAMMVVNDRHRYEHELLLARQKAEAALLAKAQAEAAMQDADRRKDEFLATLAHELRNPLGAMRNAVELMRLRQRQDDPENGSRGILERQIAQMTRLVDDLLDISRIAQGKIELRKERIDAVEAVDRALESLRPVMVASKHELNVKWQASPLHVLADPVRLSQIVQNVVGNAIKYTPPSGKIWLTLNREDGNAVVSVRDNGIGIAAEQLPHIFRMFSQVKSASGRAQGGLGIGLSLVQALVQLHGGAVSARSDGPGKGCEIVIRLPLAGAPVATSAQPEHVHPTPGSAKRILVVDDNEDAALSLALLLEVEGNDTRVAATSKEALEALCEFDAHIVILDIDLPDESGYELARKIRDATAGDSRLLLALTGWGQEEDKARAREAGFDFHLTKPIDFERLREILRNAR